MKLSTVNRRDFLAATAAGSMLSPIAWAEDQKQKNPKTVRVAFIGTGGRGTGLLRQLLRIDGVEVPAICDINEKHLARAVKIVESKRGNTPAGFSKGPYDYRRMLKRDDFDAVLIATPAVWHGEMTIDSLNAAKHVAAEVPGAYTIDECWDMVKTKEKTGLRYMLLENYSYDKYRMMVQNMVRQGVFGNCYYAECSYIHNCRGMRFVSDKKLTWRGEIKRDRYGNLYPTHSLGPVSKWMNINRGDRAVSLTSTMSKPAALHEYAVRRFGADSPAAKIKFQAGDMCVTTIKTAKGRLITVYYDTDSPRPRSDFYLIQGTNGVYDSRSGIYVDGKSKHEKWEPATKYYKEYKHDLWAREGQRAAKSGHGGGDFLELLEFVSALREDREPWIDVYDSAVWSSLVELTKKSIDTGGDSMEIPDFTRGKWKTRS